MFSLEKSQNN